MCKSLSTIVVLVSLFAITTARAQFDPGGNQEGPPINRNLDHDVVLTLTIVTPGEQPNLNRTIKQKNLDQCWESAKAWVQTENIGQKLPNSIGVGAGCGVVKRPKQEP